MPPKQLAVKLDAPVTLIEIEKSILDLQELIEGPLAPEDSALTAPAASPTVPVDARLREIALAEKLIAARALEKEKVDAYVGLHDECKRRAEAIAAQVEHLNGLKKGYAAIADRLGTCVKIASRITGKTRYQGHTREILVVPSQTQKVEVLDEAAIPKEMKKEIPVSYVVDKEKLAGFLALTPEGAVVRKDTGEDWSKVVRISNVVSVRWK